MLRSDKIDFKPKIVTRDKDGNYKKNEINLSRKCIINIYALNTTSTKYTMQILTDLKREID